MNIESYDDGLLTGFDLPDTKLFKIQSGYIECTKGAEGYAVNRIISTNLKDYLNPRFAPGEKWSN